MTFRVFNSEEQGGLRPKGAPPIVSKRPKQKNTRVPIDRLVGHWSAFERTTCARTHQLFVVERSVHVRPQITDVAARADWACVRPLLLRAIVGAFECTKCVRTHLAGISFFTWCILPFASHVLMQCPAQHKILKTLKIIRY
jgi:hypothetical protein